MTQVKRDRLRKLQDKFLKHPHMTWFVRQYGKDEPVFGPGSPSAHHLQKFIHPEYEERIRAFLEAD